MVVVVAVGVVLVVVVAVVVVVVVEKFRTVLSKMMTQLPLASEAMPEILLMQVLFDCNVCKERFAALHSACEPLEQVAKRLEILRPGKSGESH